ncbi:MAG: 1-acyl-sn-glycerol-3-phosphate acyltransferase [Saprospiraceae bacterium]|nr:1-acyl-sn-glycerol-3-phosphate acyltransferase [Saprospiraceae bacterium]
MIGFFKKLFLFAFYNSIKVIINVTKYLYYSRITTKREGLPDNAVFIVVSNHPNALMDPYLVAAALPFQVFFLANASLFVKGFARWFFSTFFCIPIARKVDNNAMGVKNDESFQKCIEHFASGGHLYIAPEGGSIAQRKLQSIKSGTARIAISTLEQHPEIPLHILPVGVNYEASTRFRKKLRLNFGAPICVKQFVEQYHNESVDITRLLTSHIEVKMKEQIIIADTKRTDNILKIWEKVAYQYHFMNNSNWFEQCKKWSDMILGDKVQHHLLSNSQSFYKLTRVTGVEKLSTKNMLFYVLGLVIGLPFFLYGFANHFFAWAIIEILIRKIKPDICYLSTFKYLGGLLFVPIFYCIQFLFIRDINADWGYCYLLSVVPLGLFAWSYFQYFQVFIEKLKWSRIKNDRIGKAMLKLEKEIIDFCRITAIGHTPR